MERAVQKVITAKQQQKYFWPTSTFLNSCASKQKCTHHSTQRNTCLSTSVCAEISQHVGIKNSKKIGYYLTKFLTVMNLRILNCIITKMFGLSAPFYSANLIYK